jgi:hypothetical protein
MHFDDRLDTVLRLQATTQAIARIQYRQLIDLLGTTSDMRDVPTQTSAAMAKLDDLDRLIPPSERAALLAEPTSRIANPSLIAHLAMAEPDVASAAIRASDLTQEDWIDLIPTLPIRARGILRHRRDLGREVEAVLERLGISDRALPPVATSDGVHPTSERPQRPELVVLEGGAAGVARPRTREEPSSAGIGAIVRQIEAFRNGRSSAPAGSHATMPDAPARTLVLAVDFTTDVAGSIDWADGPLASTLVGHKLDQAGPLRIAMSRQQPLRGMLVPLAGAPALSGTWRLDALPRFGSVDGRFLGYNGRLRRSSEDASVAPSPLPPASETMREVLHELRTPANAIQVAAEIIQQQLYGPAPHEYRALAAAIAGDTAQILAGFEELDRLVRLESGALSTAGGACDFHALVVETVARLRTWTSPRQSGFDLVEGGDTIMIAMDREEAARLLWRLLAALAGVSAAGEVSALTFALENGVATLSIDLPDELTRRLDHSAGADRPDELMRSLSSGIFGVGFTLRLAAAEASAAGGRLVREGSRMALVLPGLTHAMADHTQS